MKTLPYDYFRCKPINPDSNCKNCKRWSDMQGQTANPHGQSYCTTENSSSEACSYIPISLMEKR